MTVNDLTPLAIAAKEIKSSEWELLKRAIDSEFTLYAVNRSNKTIHYDHVAFEESGHLKIIHPYSESKQIPKGVAIPLDLQLLQELQLGNSIDELSFYSSCNEGEDYISNESLKANHFYEVTIDDVWIKTEAVELLSASNKNASTGSSITQLTQAIYDAFDEIGIPNRNQPIWDFIKKHADKKYHNLDFDGDVRAYNSAQHHEIVVIENGKPVKKKAFSERCRVARAKNKR